MATLIEKRARRLEALILTDAPLWSMGTPFAGLDEAGRGPLAGPVMAACVVLPPEPLILGVDDSKKLSAARREALYEEIIKIAVFWRVGEASPEEIDQQNILCATRLAMQRAAQGAPCALFLSDALPGLVLPGEVRSIVGGDASCYSIAAASILAKVTRDRYLLEMHRRYPDYGFDQHKGYGTAAHIEALLRHGPCPEHRRSFIGKFVGDPS